MSKIVKKQLNLNDNDTVHFTDIHINGVLNKTYKFNPEYVWNHSFVKISYYSTIASSVKVTFQPQYLHCVATFDANSRLPTIGASPIQLETQIHDFTAEPNTYKHLVLPVTGEMVSIEVTAPTYSSTGHTYLSVCATKLQSAINNS